MAANPICIALDTPDLERARDLARRLSGEAGFLKIGMEFFYAHGARGYEQVAAQGLPIFLDLKLHDIPNTVAKAVASATRLGAKIALPRTAIPGVGAYAAIVDPEGNIFQITTR